MIKKIIPKGESSRNVLTLMTGTSIAQAIPIAISPILTRIYTPNDFGVYALFISIAAIFGSIANARYEMAIMLPDRDEDALNIAALGILISTILSCALLVIVIFFNTSISILLGNGNIGFWLYFIPFSVWMIGLFNVLKYYNNRQKNYKDISRANIYKSLTSSTIQISIGLLKPGAAGLISGQLVSGIVANTKLLRNLFLNVNIKKTVTIKKMKRMAVEYINFPKFSLWAVLANTLSSNLVNILISIYFSVTTLGLYSLVRRVLGIPTSLLGSSMGQVFYQEASIEYKETGTVIKSFKSTFKKLCLISIIPFAVLYVMVADLFVLVFGEKWMVAGEYAEIFIPLFLVMFIVSPLSLANLINKKNKEIMLWQFGLLIISIAIIVYCNYLGFSFSEMAVYMVGILSLYYLWLLVITYIYVLRS